MFPSKKLWVALTLMESLVSAATPMLIAYRVVDAVCYLSRECHLPISPEFTFQSPIFFMSMLCYQHYKSLDPQIRSSTLGTIQTDSKRFTRRA